MQEQLIKYLDSETEKTMSKHITEVIGEVAGCMDEYDDVIWQDAIDLGLNLAESSESLQLFTGLNLLNGLSNTIVKDVIADGSRMNKILLNGLTSTENEIAMQALSTASNMLCIMERKLVKHFKDLVEPIAGVPVKFFNEKEEGLLDDAMNELNAMCESEPKFFKKHFKELMTVFV